MKLGRVTIEQANKLKLLGFEIPKFTSINFVPEIALVENWLEENYNINLHDCFNGDVWSCDAYDMQRAREGSIYALINQPFTITNFHKKEEAISACIDFVLDYLLQQNRKSNDTASSK